MRKFLNFKFVLYVLIIVFALKHHHNRYYVNREEVHVFVFRNDTNVSKHDLSFLHKYQQEANHEFLNKLLDCDIIEGESCTSRLWGQDKLGIMSGIYSMGKEPIFDRRWPVLHSRCKSEDAGKLRYLTSSYETPEFTMLFSAQGECGVHIFICKEFSLVCYRITFVDCRTEKSFVTKCEINSADAIGQGHHLKDLCTVPLEPQVFFEFDHLNLTTWANFKLIKRAKFFALNYVNASGEHLIYKTDVDWPGVRFLYGTDEENTCWRLPDYTFLGTSDQDTISVGPQIDVDEVCFYAYILMTTQKGLIINVTANEDPDVVFFEKTIDNEKPYTWREILVTADNITHGANVNITPILSNTTKPVDFWGIDYVTECHLMDRKVIKIYDHSEKGSSINYKKLKNYYEHEVVLHGVKGMEHLLHCPGPVSDHCVPYSWVFRNESIMSLGQKRDPTYACRCPKDFTFCNKPNCHGIANIWTMISFSLIGLIIFAVLVIVVVKYFILKTGRIPGFRPNREDRSEEGMRLNTVRNELH